MMPEKTTVAALAGYIALLLSYNPWAVLGLFLAALPAAFSEMHFSTAAFRLPAARPGTVSN